VLFSQCTAPFGKPAAFFPPSTCLLFHMQILVIFFKCCLLLPWLTQFSSVFFLFFRAAGAAFSHFSIFHVRFVVAADSRCVYIPIQRVFAVLLTFSLHFFLLFFVYFPFPSYSQQFSLGSSCAAGQTKRKLSNAGQERSKMFAFQITHGPMTVD